ncbi:MAG TPA: recombinase RecA [Candidatus Limnocylindria bacterium]|nr:recombinase RecA [Candidatus Limnocylindria bacterium]
MQKAATNTISAMAEKPVVEKKSAAAAPASEPKTAAPAAAEAAPKVNAQKVRDLEAAISSITKSFGDGAIMRLGAAVANRQIEVIPTGSLALDLALGVGGVPRGRIIEIFGPESSGKTTLMLHVIANAQKAGGVAAFIDAEHALDPGYARKLGVDLDQLLVSQPDSGEEALTICETLARSNAVDVVVVDSVAALVPKAELEGEMGMATMGMQARLMSQALRKLTAILNKGKTTCIFTNQMREKVGVMFGNPETTPGGKALKFYASVRMDIRRKDAIKDAAGNTMGNHVKVKMVKNKVAPPFAEAEFDIIFNHGIDKEGSIIDVGLEAGVVDKKGAWLQFAGELIGQGKEAARKALVDKPDLAKKITEAAIAKRIADHVTPVATSK